MSLICCRWTSTSWVASWTVKRESTRERMRKFAEKVWRSTEAKMCRAWWSDDCGTCPLCFLHWEWPLFWSRAILGKIRGWEIEKIRRLLFSKNKTNGQLFVLRAVRIVRNVGSNGFSFFSHGGRKFVEIAGRVRDISIMRWVTFSVSDMYIHTQFVKKSKFWNFCNAIYVLLFDRNKSHS